jgi:hypothetical protein
LNELSGDALVVGVVAANREHYFTSADGANAHVVAWVLCAWRNGINVEYSLRS